MTRFTDTNTENGMSTELEHDRVSIIIVGRDNVAIESRTTTEDTSKKKVLWKSERI